MTVPHAGPYRAYLAAFAFGWVLVALAACNTEPAIPTSPSTRLLLSRDSVTLEIGDTATIRARAATGAQWVDDAVVSWSSSGPAVASVSSTGLVTGISAGTATITARFGAISRSAHVRVLGPVTRIVVDQASIDVVPGWAARLVAVGEDAAGHQRPVSITWESSDSNVVRPPTSDYILGGRVGRATLTARSRNVSATVATVVRPRAGVLTLLASNILFDLALDGSRPVQWPIQPTRLPDDATLAGFDWSDTGRLLYSCGDTRVCLVAPSGATEVVTVPSQRAFGPSWWPDSRRIVYGVRGGVQTFDPATRSVEAIPLTELPISIRVAPNGTSLAFVNLNEEYDPSVWVKDANGIRMIPEYCWDTDWSADGTKLAALCHGGVYLEHNGSPQRGFSLPSATRVRWDPSGNLLAFLDVGGSGLLRLTNPDGTGQMFWLPPSHIFDDTQTFAWRRP